MEHLVLASGSAARRAMLEAAGLTVVPDPPNVDESALKADCRSRRTTVNDAAMTLAIAKARAVSPRWPGRLVLAADQMLECDAAWFDKPPDRKAAARQLVRLSGRVHRLISSAVVFRDGALLWRSTTMAEMKMRELSQAFIDDYLDRAGDAVLGSVGVYQIEGIGVQLFDAVDGDHFTILGLPLLPLLGFLREAELLPS